MFEDKTDYSNVNTKAISKRGREGMLDGYEAGNRRLCMAESARHNTYGSGFQRSKTYTTAQGEEILLPAK